MEILVIIVLLALVAAVVLRRTLSGKRRNTAISTGNPSANEGDDRI
ncbi:hypothetical protein ACFYV7_29230 [Nocardia suismassiliense]|uniref:Uncharacterized protein n=1 Tax=Nocardia suismassiliense TaxID=2077092 RepID=A0ABW6R2B8_9NOCA